MKVAVLNTNGVQQTLDGKIKYYFEVSDNYDFTANEATDVTSVQNLILFIQLSRIDLIKLRDCAKAHLLSDWNNLSDADKKYLVSVYIYPANYTQEQIDELFTASEQLDNWENLVYTTKTNREKRWEIARQQISFQLTELEILSLYTITKTYKGDYIDANLPYLILWITNGVYAPLGIDFTNNGFKQQNYYSDSRRDLLIDILIKGNL